MILHSRCPVHQEHRAWQATRHMQHYTQHLRGLCDTVQVWVRDGVAHKWSRRERFDKSRSPLTKGQVVTALSVALGLRRLSIALFPLFGGSTRAELR